MVEHAGIGIQEQSVELEELEEETVVLILLALQNMVSGLIELVSKKGKLIEDLHRDIRVILCLNNRA